MKIRVFSRVLLLVLIVCMALTLVACAKDKDFGAERILRMDIVGNTGFPAMYTTASNGPGYAIMSYMFDTLVWKDDKGELNLLADHYSVSNDQLTYTFRLREGVTFHDGTPFTGEDVKFTFDYTALHPYQWIATTMVKEVRVVDDLTVEVELNRPMFLSLQTLPATCQCYLSIFLNMLPSPPFLLRKRPSLVQVH